MLQNVPEHRLVQPGFSVVHGVVAVRSEQYEQGRCGA